MNINERKTEAKQELEEARMEAVLLIARIDEALKDLKNVQTEDDAEEFDKKYDNIEDGLKHISLF